MTGTKNVFHFLFIIAHGIILSNSLSEYTICVYDLGCIKSKRISPSRSVMNTNIHRLLKVKHILSQKVGKGFPAGYWLYCPVLREGTANALNIILLVCNETERSTDHGFSNRILIVNEN